MSIKRKHMIVVPKVEKDACGWGTAYEAREIRGCTLGDVVATGATKAEAKRKARAQYGKVRFQNARA